MLFLSGLLRHSSLLLVLTSSVLAAKSPKSSDKLTALVSLSSKHKGVITLDDSLYNELTEAPREYYAAVLLTALDPRYGCQLCREFHPEFDLIGKSWLNKNAGGGGMLFGSLDFGSGRATFQKLQLTTAPVLLLFPPTLGPNARPNDGPARYDFSPGSAAPAEAIAAWISRTSSLEITIKRPFNWSKLITFVIGTLGAATALKFLFPFVAPIIYNRNLWAAISLIMVLLFTSGHMFNHIRKVPYVVNDGKGGLSYIAGGFSNQFGLETQIIAVLYAVLAFCTISLALKTPRIEDPKRQMTAIMVWNLVMLCLFSFLFNLFKVKNGSYPFFLPPFVT